MKILAISSATPAISVSIGECEITIADNDVHSEDVVAMIDALSKLKGESIDDVEAVSVVSGPGSYGGLRGGLAAAKSFAQAKNIPVVGVSTLEAIAYNLKDVEGTIISILHACRDEINVALFGAFEGCLKRLTEDFVTKESALETLKNKISGKIYITDSIPYARNVAMLGKKYLMEGKADNYLSMAPNYSHQPNIREYGNKY